MTENQPFPRQQLLLWLTLIFASGICAVMWSARALYSTVLVYLFLLWNLFLAWLPLLFAGLASRWRRRSFLGWVFSGLWLLFFPNALYLVTDLLHLSSRSNVPVWYDLIMLFGFALTGLFLGFVSLSLMQSMVADRFGRWVGWLFVLAALGLSSFGVYIGRFLRWNSWDALIRPLSLLHDIGLYLTAPTLFLKTIVATGLLTAVFICAYLIMSTLPSLYQTH